MQLGLAPRTLCAHQQLVVNVCLNKLKGIDCLAVHISPHKAGNFDFIQNHRPKIVINENVAALEFGGERSLLRQITDQLESVDYKAVAFHLSPTDFGIPQSRPRVYILAVDRR